MKLRNIMFYLRTKGLQCIPVSFGTSYWPTDSMGNQRINCFHFSRILCGKTGRNPGSASGRSRSALVLFTRSVRRKLSSQRLVNDTNSWPIRCIEIHGSPWFSNYTYSFSYSLYSFQFHCHFFFCF